MTQEQSDPRSSRRFCRGTWLLALVSVILTVFLLEVGARVATLALYGRSTQGQVELCYFPFLETLETTSPLRVTRQTEPDLKFLERIMAAMKPKDGRLRVIVIGASTARGLPGQLLASKLGELYHREVEVVNLAIPGFIINQEVVMLGLFGINLQPDLVISIDGANDPVAASKTGKPGVAIPALSLAAAVQSPVQYALASVGKRLQLITLVLKLFERGREQEFQSRRDLVEATAQQYLQGVRALSIMTRGAGAGHVLLLQPYLHLRKNLTADELNLGLAKQYSYRSRFMTDYLGALAGRMRALSFASGTVFVDGTTAFDGSPETCFRDEIHLTDRGYELLVEKIVAHIRGVGLDKAAAADSGLWPLAPPPGKPTVQVDFPN